MNINDVDIHGVYSAMITPFKRNGDLDEGPIRENIDYLVNSGMHGIVVGGSAGEFYALSTEKRKRLLKVVVDHVKGRTKVMGGTGAITTEETLELTKYAEEIGCNSAIIITPYYSLPKEDEICEHYKVISDNSNIPICLYNFPARTNINLYPKIVERLAKIDNVAAIKDSSMNFSQMINIMERTSNQIGIICGNDPLIFSALILGAVGCISVATNIVGEEVIKLYNCLKKNKIEEARRVHWRILKLVNGIYSMGVFPAGIKEAVNLLNRKGGFPHRPSLSLGENEKKEIYYILKELKLVK